MVDAVNSGYKESAQTVSWTAYGPDSMAVELYTALSDVIDNSSLKHLFADFTLSITFGTTDAGDGESVALYLIPQVEDNTDPEWSGNSATDAPENEQYYIGSFTVTTGNDAQVTNLRGVALPPGLFKVACRNTGTGISTAATLKYRRWNYASQ